MLTVLDPGHGIAHRLAAWWACDHSVLQACNIIFYVQTPR